MTCDGLKQKPFFRVFHSGAARSSGGNGFEKSAGIIEHSPTVGQWQIQLEQVVQAALEAAVNILGRNIVPALFNPKCHPLNRQIGSGQRDVKQDHLIASGFAVAQELRDRDRKRLHEFDAVHVRQCHPSSAQRLVHRGKSCGERIPWIAADLDMRDDARDRTLARADQREALRGDVAAQIAQANQGVQQEKNRLAALMAELTQSVVVCNLDGRILLYNSRARLQFRALSQAPTLADGAELIGIGRSIYAVFDRALVAHALERIQERRARGAAQPSAQFITTTRSGQLLKVQMAPVGQVGASDDQAPLAGFVLMLDNVTRHFEDEAQRDQTLQSLTDGSRSALANIQAAVDMLGYDDVEPAMRERFLAVVRDEVRTMTTRLNDSVQRAAEGLKTRWPMEEMLAADLITAAQRRIEAHCGFKVVVEEVEGNPGYYTSKFFLRPHYQRQCLLMLRINQLFQRPLHLRLYSFHQHKTT